MRHSALFFAVALAGAALDLWTKHLAFTHVPDYPREIVIVEGFFHFGKVMNTGVIFGMGDKAPIVWKVISVLAAPIILAIFFSVRKPKWILTISLGLILAGTIGNMVDRLAYSAVRDFLKFFYESHVWPLFNIADSCICVGVLLLSIEMLFFEEGRKKNESPESPPAIPSAAGPGTAVEGR